jgi:hypothetical protein
VEPDERRERLLVARGPVRLAGGEQPDARTEEPEVLVVEEIVERALMLLISLSTFQ